MPVGGSVGWSGSGSVVGPLSSLPRPLDKLVQGDGLGVWGLEIGILGSENGAFPLGWQVAMAVSERVAGAAALVAVVAEGGVLDGIMLEASGGICSIWVLEVHRESGSSEKDMGSGGLG